MGDDLAPDWILQQALGVQSAAHRSFVREKGLAATDEESVLVVLGCGAIGTAILQGLLKAASEKNAVGQSPSFTRFRACVRTREKKARIEKELGTQEWFGKVEICVDNHKNAIQGANVILLSCSKDAVPVLLSENAVKKALSGRFLISVVAGWTSGQIRQFIYGHEQQMPGQCTIVCAAPSITASCCQSVTAVARSSPPFTADQFHTIHSFFEEIGSVEWVPEAHMRGYTALCSSSPALVSVMLEAVAASAVAAGVSREDSHSIAARLFRDTADTILRGEHPAVLRERTNTPAGHTSVGLAVLEEAAIRGTITKAIRSIADSV